MTLTPEADAAIRDLTIPQLDEVLRLTHADLTWCSPDEANAVWSAIDHMLDRRNQLTNSCSSHNNSSIQEAKS